MKFIKRFAALLLALIIVFAGFPADSLEAFAKETVFEIASAADWLTFAAKVNAGDYDACAKVTAEEINFAEINGWENGIPTDDINRIMICGNDKAYPYKGTFDGNNCKVKGLVTEKEFDSKFALFGYLGTTGIIKNINVVDANINVKMINSVKTGTAAILYTNSGGKVENCHVSGIIVNGTSGQGAAAIVYNNASGTVERCSNSASIQGSKNVGGIVGTGSGGKVENCYNMGDITSTGSNGGTGGIIGNNGGATVVSNCCNRGTVFNAQNKYVQPIAGKGTGNPGAANIINCYALDGCVEGYSGTKYYGYNEDGSIIKTGVTLEQFKSGEIAYLLSQGAGEGVWGQTIGTDDYPVLGGTPVIYKSGIYKNTGTASSEINEKANIVLKGEAPSFGNLEFGYEYPGEAVFTFINNGTAAADGISAVITEGTDIFSAECTQSSCAANEEFTVKVNTVTGLTNGEYKGKLEVSWNICEKPLVLELSQKVTAVAPSLTVDIEGWTYGNTPNLPTWSYSGSDMAMPKIEYRLKDENMYTETVPQKAGNYIVKVSFLSVDGYEDAYKTAEFTIAKRPVTPSIIGEAEKVYDGGDAYEGDALSITLSNTVESDDIKAAATSYSFDSATVGENKTVTANKIKLSGKDMDNYELTAIKATAAGKITKKIPNVTWPSFKGIHIGTKLSAIELPGGFTWDDPETAVKDGTHKYPATYIPTDTESFETVKGEISVTANDQTPPTGIITVGAKTWSSKIEHNEVKFDTYYNGAQTVSIEGFDPESGVLNIEYAMLASQTANINSIVWTEYKEPFTVSKEGNNIIYAKITSEAGYFTVINTDGFVIDTKYPVVSGIDNGKTYCEAQNFAVEGADIVKIDGVETESRVLLAGGERTVTATDKAGNSTTVIVTVNSGHTAKYIAEGSTIKEECLYCGTPIASVNLTVPTENLVYTGLEHEAMLGYEGEFSKGNNFVVEYFSKGEKVDSTAAAGKYTAKITAPEGATFVSINYEIAKVRLEVKAKDAEINYGDEAKQNGVTYSGFVNGENEAVLGGRLSYSFPLYDRYGDAIDYSINPSGLTSDNYEIAFMSGNLAVKPLLATVNWTSLSDEELIYSGENKTVTAKVVNTVNGDEVEVEIELTGDNINVTEDGFYFTATALSNENYILRENETSAVYKIKKADPKPNWPSGLNIASGKQLKNIAIESGFAWTTPETEITYGEHEFEITFTPEDMNNYNAVSKNIAVYGNDITPPRGKVTVGTNSWSSLLNEITFGLFFSKTQEVTIAAEDSESGVAKIEYYLAAEKTESFEAVEWTEYKAPFSIDPDKKFVLYAKITDNAGVSAIINSDGVIIETAKAVIPGIETGKEYFGETVFEIPEEYDVTVILDGEIVIQGSFASKMKNAGAGSRTIVVPADNKEHTLEIMDSVGNKTEFKITVYKTYTVTFIADGVTVDTQTVGHGKSAEPPVIPEKAGHIAKGWDKSPENITEDTVITAVYEKNGGIYSFEYSGTYIERDLEREEENPNTGYGA